LRLPKATRSKAFSDTLAIRVPRAASAAIQSANVVPCWSVVESCSRRASTKASTISTPETAARESSRRPSTTVSPVDRRSSASRSAAACLIRGLAGLPAGEAA
jgi:hypothetical protein